LRALPNVTVFGSILTVTRPRARVWERGIATGRGEPEHAL
jgi:hypothetical protein